jgi:hypothetical protein
LDLNLKIFIPLHLRPLFLRKLLIFHFEISKFLLLKS